MSSINFCKRCMNFVERRDIEGFAACVRNHTPRVACDEFKPKPDAPPMARKGMGFCLYCENLVVINGFAVCVRNHIPRIACEDFKDSFSYLRKETSSKRMDIAKILTSIW